MYENKILYKKSNIELLMKTIALELKVNNGSTSTTVPIAN